MAKLSVFNQVSLDGYFVDDKGDMSWAHRQDPEWEAYSADNAKGPAVLVFGRITYQMMEGFWPTPAAQQSMPAVAEGMNSMPKVVFSRTLDKVTWNNTKLVKSDIAGEIRRMKQASGPDMVVMGSGTIVAQLTAAGLVDTYQLVVNPLILGRGRTMFEGIDRQTLRLTGTRSFRNGNVVLSYERAA